MTSGDGHVEKNEVWLVRHGPTEWSKAGRHTGRTDLPLTEDGEVAAACVAAGLAGHEFGLVLSSPLQRAVHTAELAGCVRELDADLREWDYGAVRGPADGGNPRGTSRLVAVDGRRARRGNRGGRGGACRSRHCAGARRGRQCAAVCPRSSAPCAGGPLGRGASDVRSASAPGTAAVCILGYERETPALSRWNDTSHLDGGRRRRSSSPHEADTTASIKWPRHSDLRLYAFRMPAHPLRLDVDGTSHQLTPGTEWLVGRDAAVVPHRRTPSAGLQSPSPALARRPLVACSRPREYQRDLAQRQPDQRDRGQRRDPAEAGRGWSGSVAGPPDPGRHGRSGWRAARADRTDPPVGPPPPAAPTPPSAPAP